jgi:uncharacterized protein (DUF2141 family)
MKKMISLGFAALMSFSAMAAAFPQQDLEIEIHGIEQIKGEIRVALFNQKSVWLKTSALNAKVSVTGKKVTVTMANVPEGEYAISVYHDVNSNGKLDRNGIGMPTEPYAFSNNAQGNFGPPSFDSAKVKIEANTKVLSLHLN